MTHAPPSWVRYLVVWLCLVGLTALSWGISLLHLGAADVVLALVIAAVKTALVVLFFMHLAHERFSIVMVPCVAVFFVALLIALTATDVATRHTFPRAPAPDVDELPGLSD